MGSVQVFAHPTRPACAGRRESAATYRRRRAAVVAAVVATIAVGGVVVQGALSVPGGVPASAAGNAPVDARRAVVAHVGDTLWALARSHHGSVDVDRYLDELIDLNGGTRIEVGQQVLLP